MKNSNTITSNEKQQNTETNIKLDSTSKSINEISTPDKQLEENTKSEKNTNKFDKTTQSFCPPINHNKSKIRSKYRELIIDTRNTPLNDHTHKFDFVKYRHEKYQTHKYPTKITKEKINLDKPIIVYTDVKTSNADIYDNNKISLQKKIKIMKNQLINSPINGLIPSYSLSYNHLPHYPIADTLPTILTLRKNQFMEYNKRIDNAKEGIEKLNQMQFLMNNNSMPISSYYGNKSNYKKHVDMQNQPFSYIYLLDNNYSISEKMRFQKNMDKLIKVKKCIEENHNQEFEIAKEFILSIGIYDLKNFDIEKLNNFLNFIKSDFLIDPSINMRQNILNIMNKKNINKPQISNALDCINEEYVLKEIEKRQNLIKYKRIGDVFSFFEESYKYNRELMNSKNKSKTNIKISNTSSEEKFIKNKKSKSKKILRQHPLEYKGLCIDLKRQQKISSPESKLEIDIIQNPKNVIDFVKKDIIKQKTEKKYNKTCYNWSKNVLNNKRLYDNKKKDESLYNEVRKKNMLTDYIVLLKAKNNIKYSKLKEQYKI
jgi:hypothetical protein